MITIENDLTLQYGGMGLFDTDAEWIHPTVTVDTCEIILVLSGRACIFEGERRYCVHPGEWLILSPKTEHGGYEVNTGHTSFYWLHFHTNSPGAWGLPKYGRAPHNAEKLLRQIMHVSRNDPHLAELALAQFFLELRAEGGVQNRTAHEVREYLRIHASRGLRVSDVARHFGYSGDHLSGLYRREFGIDLKGGINRARIAYIESLLLNTDASVKEVAMMSGFADENAFVKFFKYHEGITPSTYRHRFYHIHMNSH